MQVIYKLMSRNIGPPSSLPITIVQEGIMFLTEEVPNFEPESFNATTYPELLNLYL